MPLQIVKYWLLPLLYMALIFFLSSMPKPPIPRPVEWELLDKLYHVAEYILLGLLIARALLNTLPRLPFGLVWILAFCVASVYGASDEWHQSFVPGREADSSDWIADSLGGGLGVLVMYIWFRLSAFKK